MTHAADDPDPGWPSLLPLGAAATVDHRATDETGPDDDDLFADAGHRAGSAG